MTGSPSPASSSEDRRAPKISINFWPWHPVRDILSNTESALKYFPYDTIYLCDEYQYSDLFAALAAITMEFEVSVGTFATFVSRNPCISRRSSLRSRSSFRPARSSWRASQLGAQFSGRSC